MKTKAGPELTADTKSSRKLDVDIFNEITLERLSKIAEDIKTGLSECSKFNREHYQISDRHHRKSKV
jgi:hypothetical protein